MTAIDTFSRDETFSSLQRLLGVHKWTLNLETGLMRIEYGREYGEIGMHELTIDTLARISGPDGIRLHREHWDRAARLGHDGPVSLPFANAQGEISYVESVCEPYNNGKQRLLIGHLKRVSHKAELGRNARLLTEFLESFIANSPSGIVVVDHQGNVVSANREFIRFVGRGERGDVVQNSVLNMIYAVSPGLGQVVREALRATETVRGRYEVTYNNGMRQTLYWRAFPLSMDASLAPPRVFAFDLNEGGARSVAA